MALLAYGIRRRPLCSFGRNNFQGAKIQFLQQENGLLKLKGRVRLCDVQESLILFGLKLTFEIMPKYVGVHTVPCKKTRHEILQSDVLAILTTFHIEL